MSPAPQPVAEQDRPRCLFLDRGWPDELHVKVWRDGGYAPLSDEKIDSINQEDAERDARLLQRQRDSERRDREFAAEVDRRVLEDKIRAEVIAKLPADVRERLYPRPAVPVVNNSHGSAGGSGDGLLPFLAGAAAADLWRALT